VASKRLLAAVVVALSSLPFVSARAQGAAPKDTVRSAALDGVVRDSVGSALEGAIVTIEAVGRTVLSDRDGRFRLGGLPSDTIDVSVRRVGFAPAYFAIAIPPATTVSIAVKMLPNTVKLGTVVVEGEARDLTLNRNGFYDRKRFMGGVFLDAKFMEQRRGLKATTLLREVPRVRVSCPPRGGMGCTPLVPSGAGLCVPDLVIDGMVVPSAGNEFDFIVDTRYVRGIEVYRTFLETPSEFRRPQNACGSIVVWTEFAPPAKRKTRRLNADASPDSASVGT
jgi:hypothetical protein